MAKSEEMTGLFNPASSSTKGHYSVGTVYEEYGRSYANLGEMPKALNYLDLARKNLPQTKFWELLISTAKAVAFVKGGEIEKGVQLAMVSGEECINTGNIRFLDRIHMIEQFLDEQEKRFREAKSEIKEIIFRGKATEF